MALTAAACMTACDDSSSSSYEIPSYASGTSLPDTCSMEVAKVDTAYFACFENKWIEVTDSARTAQGRPGRRGNQGQARRTPKPAAKARRQHPEADFF